jgi:hypothetical protein
VKKPPVPAKKVQNDKMEVSSDSSDDGEHLNNFQYSSIKLLATVKKPVVQAKKAENSFDSGVDDSKFLNSIQ